MSDTVSINKVEAGTIYRDSNTIIGEVRDALSKLDKLILELPKPGRGEWSGLACNTFMGVYEQLQTKITTDFPNTLEELTKNLDTNLKNLVAADEAGA